MRSVSLSSQDGHLIRFRISVTRPDCGRCSGLRHGSTGLRRSDKTASIMKTSFFTRKWLRYSNEELDTFLQSRRASHRIQARSRSTRADRSKILMRFCCTMEGQSRHVQAFKWSAEWMQTSMTRVRISSWHTIKRWLMIKTVALSRLHTRIHQCAKMRTPKASKTS